MDSGILEYLYLLLSRSMLIRGDLSPAQLRTRLRQRRRALTVHQQRHAARQLAIRITRLPAFRHAHRIGFYLAGDGEIDPAPLLKRAQAQGKACYLPVLLPFPSGHLGFVRYRRSTRLHRHHYDIHAPQQRPRLSACALDLVCMPLVGFDSHGRRLGMGGGFYDRSLAGYRNRRVVKLGLAHTCQQVDTLDARAWDIPLDTIVTPDRILCVRPLNAVR